MEETYALLDENKRAMNFIRWDGEAELDLAQLGASDIVLVPEGARYDFGWLWNGKAFVNDVVEPIEIPEKVSRKQVRLLLLGQGLLDNVEAMIAQQDKATQIEWQDSLEFHRDNPLLNQLAANLGLSNAQIDQFFIAAAEL